MSNIRFSIRRQVTVIWHILANIGDAGDDINNLTKGSFNNGPFWPNTYLQWTITDKLHIIYPLFKWPSDDFLLIINLPLLVHVVIEWPWTERILRSEPKFFFFDAYWRVIWNNYFMMLFIIQIANLGIYLPTSERLSVSKAVQKWHAQQATYSLLDKGCLKI